MDRRGMKDAALASSLRPRWLWFSMLCVLCWGAWSVLSKLGSREIPPETMQFLFAAGMVPVALSLLAARRFRLERRSRDNSPLKPNHRAHHQAIC